MESSEVISTVISQRTVDGSMFVDEATGAVLSAEIQIHTDQWDDFILQGAGVAFRFNYLEFIRALADLRDQAISRVTERALRGDTEMDG